MRPRRARAFTRKLAVSCLQRFDEGNRGEGYFFFSSFLSPVNSDHLVILPPSP
jgi:hypothetical protein